jgi:hypothetical protein
MTLRAESSPLDTVVPPPTVPHSGSASSRDNGSREPSARIGAEIGGTRSGPASAGPVNLPGLLPCSEWVRCRYCGRSLPNSHQRKAHERVEERRLGKIP